MRVGLDGRGLGNINRFRGIGRYTARLTEALAELAPADMRFVLFGYGDGPDPGLLGPRALERMEWRRIPSLDRYSYPGLLGEHLLAAREVERAGVDLFHGMDHNMTPFLRCPSLVTVHDLILLVLRGPYLGPTAWTWMRFHRRAARRADAVVAVSENTARDVERIWGIPRDRIVVVYEGVSAEYRPVADAAEVEAAAARYGIEGPYLLYLGGFDPRKNLHNMLLAFKRFILSTRGGYRMVLCGDARGFEGYLGDLVAELGLEDDVVFTGFVREGDLPALYSGAAAFVCVSLYEGFGLPVLEAMACGAPVLASRRSSLPEVAGGAALLVDPTDVDEIRAGMEKLARDGRAAAELREAGPRRAAGFTWGRTAESIMELYGRVMAGGDRDQGL